MTNRGNRIFQGPILAIGLAACALACGSDSDTSEDAAPSEGNAAVQPTAPEPGPVALPPAAVPTPRPEPAAPTPAPAAGAPPTADEPEEEICTPTAEGVLDFDQLYELVSIDLGRADADDAVFYRYVSLSDRFQSGACFEPQLERGRQGLVKMLNMLSISASLESTVPIDSDGLVHRIDLRDFEWDRAISVNGVDFVDVWEAILANNPYAVEFVGDQADDAKADAATTVPLMFADQMMDVATIGNLYYAIIDVDVTQTLGAFIANELGIDEVADVIDGEVIRAGTTQSAVSRQDRLAQRHDIQVRSGVLWQSFDFEDAAGNDSIFEDPFGFQAGAREAIFTLPNGMLGFIIADAQDAIVEDTDILLDATRDDFLTVTAVSCSNCHARGFLPVIDEVGPASLANARALGLNNDEVLGLEFLYVPPSVFQQVVNTDSEAFYLRSLERLEVSTQGRDPVAAAVLRFDEDLVLADAAGDLGVSPDDLDRSLDLLDPSLSILSLGSTVDRDDFTDVFVASLCTLSTTLENQPDAAVCDAAIAALDL